MVSNLPMFDDFILILIIFQVNLSHKIGVKLPKVTPRHAVYYIKGFFHPFSAMLFLSTKQAPEITRNEIYV